MKVQTGDMVLIATCSSAVEARLYKGVLEQAGIPCFIQGEHHRDLLGNWFGPHIEPGLMVPEEHEDEAIDILNHASQSNPDDWSLPGQDEKTPFDA